MTTFTRFVIEFLEYRDFENYGERHSRKFIEYLRRNNADQKFIIEAERDYQIELGRYSDLQFIINNDTHRKVVACYN